MRAMRFIGKKSVCAAALGLLPAFYFVRKRKLQVKRIADAVEYLPQSQDAPNCLDVIRLISWRRSDR